MDETPSFTPEKKLKTEIDFKLMFHLSEIFEIGNYCESTNK